MSDVTSTFDSFLVLTNQLINFVPLGLYFFAYFTAIVFQDMRGGLLMLGLFLNDLVGIFNNKYLGNKQLNPNCAIYKTRYNNFVELPNEHTEIVTFFSTFFYSEMFNKKKTDWFKFIFLLLLILVTIWSRINIGCEVDMKKIIFSILSGVVRGILFYYIFSNQWEDLSEEKNSSKNKVDCKYESNNYTCETIKDGKLVLEKSNTSD